MVLLHIHSPYGLVPTPMRSPVSRLAPLLLAVLLTALAGPAAAQTPLGAFATGLSSPVGVTQLADGRVLVAEFGGSRVAAFAADGTGRTVFAAGLVNPYDVTQLADGRVLVVENGGVQVAAFAVIPGATITGVDLIVDTTADTPFVAGAATDPAASGTWSRWQPGCRPTSCTCLLYTSDAADE